MRNQWLQVKNHTQNTIQMTQFSIWIKMILLGISMPFFLFCLWKTHCFGGQLRDLIIDINKIHIQHLDQINQKSICNHCLELSPWIMKQTNTKLIFKNEPKQNENNFVFLHLVAQSVFSSHEQMSHWHFTLRKIRIGLYCVIVVFWFHVLRFRRVCFCCCCCFILAVIIVFYWKKKNICWRFMWAE